MSRLTVKYVRNTQVFNMQPDNIPMTREMAIQEINRLIDFYRDMVSKSNYKSADHTIKQAERALELLSNQKLCQCEDI